MSLQKNTAQVWDEVWKDPGLSREDELILAAEAATLRWQKIKKVLLQEFKTLQNLEVLEIGSGIGTYAALLAREGAKATLLDYSPEALIRAKEFFASNQLKVTTVQGDALNLPPKLHKKKFDISISIGLNEHFTGKKRLQINKVHVDVLKKNGIAIIDVPNAYNPPYRIFKFLSELLGTWKFGEEYPYTRSELLEIGEQINGKFLALFGDEFYSSIKFLLPANFLRRWFGVGIPLSKNQIRKQNPSFLDDTLGYSLILMLQKR